MPRHTSRRFFAIVTVLTLRLLLGVPTAAPGAEPTAGSPSACAIDESALVAGYGTSRITEGRYEPLLLIWQVGVDLQRFFPVLKRATKGHLHVFLEPQVNVAFRPEADFEVGIGVGVKYRYPVTEKVSLYVLAATGVQYITVQTHDQANGFNFSDVAGGGVYYFFSHRHAVSVGYRYRHISNASLERPNGGINSHFGTIGFSTFF